MRKNLILSILFAASACLQAQDLSTYVNPFIGTGGHGHTSPAAVVPHGMIQPGPDTRMHGWDACSGYYYADTTLNGFTQTRLSGTGCGDLADFLLMPLDSRPDLAHRGEKVDVNRCPWASPFSHDDEVAQPGYYGVSLQRYGVRAEITATERTAFYRFAYGPGERFMLVDLDYNNQDQYLLEAEWSQPDPRTLRLFRRTLGWAYNQPIYLQAEFSRPFTVEEFRDTVRTDRRTYPRCKLVLRFDSAEAEAAPLLVKAAVSAVDADGAARNLRSELPGWDFDSVRTAARHKWNNALGRIELTDLGGQADSVRSIFYTALYHALLAPQLFCDVDGRYLGTDLRVHRCDPQADPMYSVFSLWDTHRALHPLISIIDPARNEAYIRSLTRKGEQLGVVPKWELNGNDTGCMIGQHFVSLLADMYAKGYRDYDVQAAYRQALRTSLYDTTGVSRTLPRWKMGEIMPEGLRWREQQGLIPCDRVSESVAKALEYAYDDWCVAQVAQGLGDRENARRFTDWASCYRLYFDPSVRFMRGKTEAGQWRQPFDPTGSDHRQDDYTEGNAWQWSFFAPHDPQGLIALYGGRAPFLAKLDSLFAAPSVLTGDNVSPDISGLIGQYAHGNEPSHGTLYLYNYAGQPWKTQALADSVMRTLYAAGPDGLSGNEDCGQMSAWYLLSAMGFYQLCPGRPEYTVGRPLFGEVVVHQPSGKDFVIRAKGNSPRHKYVRSMRLNGKRLRSPFFTHEQLMNGGVLELEMTSAPPR